MAQISVGIQLHENQIRVLFRHSSHGSGADGVFATEHQWFEAECKNRLRGLFHLGDHGFWGAERDLNGSEIREAEIVEIPIQLGAVVSRPLLTSRIAAGPNRVPGRNDVVPS